MRVDNGGEFWDTVFDVVSLCFSVVDVIKNPDDPWAWVGLAADVVSLAVPFATGGGSVVKAVSKADDVVDLAKSADRAMDAIDTVSDIGKVAGKVDDVGDTVKAAQNISGVSKRFTKDQDIIIQWAKEYKKAGISMDDAEALVDLAKQYGIPGNPRIDLGHPGRGPISRKPHVHIGSVGHIPIR